MRRVGGERDRVGRGPQLLAERVDRGPHGGGGQRQALGGAAAVDGRDMVPATKKAPSRTGPSTTARKAAVSRPRSVTLSPRKFRVRMLAMLTQATGGTGVA